MSVCAGDVGGARHRAVRGDADHGRHLGRRRLHQRVRRIRLQLRPHLGPGALRIRPFSVHK